MLARGEIAVDQRLGLLAGEDEDLRLWRIAARGDQRAFEQIVDRHRGRLTSVVARLLEDPEDTIDAVQETFVRAWEYRQRFRGSSVRGWLVGIALNICRNRRRSHWRRRLFMQRQAPKLLTRPEDAGRIAENQLQDDELAAAVAALPESLRVPFTLRFYEELSGVEIAAALGCPESTVWTRIYAARRELRRALGVEP
jgi:RNA polymerase sigma factor (sigma-70 family)